MKIINKNVYKIMFGLEFIAPNEVKELDDKIAKELIKHPNVEEYIGVEDVKNLEGENEKLKKELELEKAKNRANELGISYAKNIGLAALLKKIEKFENAE